ncbi:MAG: 2-hydroxyacyl-CoA dehydratase subunit D [Thermodesulfobacteriota bacterium]
MDVSKPPSRKEYMTMQKGRGRGLFGVFPGRYPRELFWSHGVLPMEIWDPVLDTSGSGVHLQPTICSIVKAGLELIIQGKCDDLDGFLFPHTCDSIQNLGSMVRDYLDVSKPCLFFYPPKAPYGRASRVFFRRELERLALELEGIYGRPDRDALHNAVVQGREVQKTLAALYAARAEGRLDASNSEFYRVVRLVEYMHPDDMLPAMKEFLDQRTTNHSVRTPCLVLSGVLPNPEGLFPVLDQLGLRVGDDDLLSCGRRLSGETDSGLDALDSLVESILGMPACSTINSPIEERRKQIIRKTGRCSAGGVLFNVIKFCEPDLFYYPYLRESLRKQGIKTLFLENEVNRDISGQTETRIEAFAEMIRRRRE